MSRKKRLATTSFVLLGTFALLVSVINFSDRFYTYALENDVLNPIVKTLRFIDIFEESESIEFDKESFSLKLLKTGDDYEVVEDEMNLDLEEGSYLIYQHSDGKNLYFTQFEKTEGLYDLKSFIWSYNLGTKEMTKILDLNNFDADGLLSNYRVIEDKVHLVTENYNDDGNVSNRILIIKDGHVVEEKTSLKMRANYNQNYINFMDDGTYLTLNQVDDKYCYEISGQTFKCFEGELSPNNIPILNLEAMTDEYYIMKESIVTLSDINEGIGPNDIKSRSLVFDRQGNEMYTLENSRVTIVVDNVLILQHADESYTLLNLTTGSQEEFVSMSDLYYGLQDLEIETIAFELKDNVSSYSYISSKNPYFSEEGRRFLTFTDIKEQVITFSDESANKLRFFKITFLR